MARLTLPVALLALAVATAALVLELTRSDAGDVAERIVYVSHTAANDATDAKEAKVTCPDGTILLGGGSAIQHGHDTPGHSLAVYQGYPVANGWDVQAHETDPETEARWPWDVTSVAICLRR
jgi:hypothetical protein